MFEGNALPSGPTTAVAIDREKNSQQAVKWAVESLLASNSSITLVHVRVSTATTAQGYESSRNGDQKDPEGDLFRTYRLFCATKGMKLKEAVLEDVDVSKALLEYINSNYINNIVVGSSNRNVLTRKFRTADVPTTLLKAAPDFCSVYVICKGKAVIVKAAKNQASNTPPPPPRQALIAANPRQPSLSDSEDNIRPTATRGGWRGPLPPSDRRQPEGTKTPPRDRPLSTAKSVPTNMLLESFDSSTGRPPRLRDSFSEDLDFHGRSSTSDFGDSIEFSSLTESPKSSTSPMASRDMEAEMKRLKLELKQTMDMYSTACKEAISAKQKAKELDQWKLEEARKFEEARQSEEAALAIAEMEKARARAAIEAAQAAQRIAELEAKKRLHAELAAKREAEEKKRALAALNHNDIRYRKYSIEEIEVATNNFAEGNKIGEGGYGPVYRACLDHTPVAVKILRPDAAQGKKQFQQEVEVLSCIRHPNMVLLLGACPEYGCLVYEYMDNGSLDDRLFRRGNTPPIPWRTRFKIAAEIATGLLFLHQSKPEPLVHRDLKPGNILLDRNYVSKISDVGLARLVPPSVADNVTQYRMTSTAGTFCYIDPEYQQTGMLGTKSDIYSFGVLLLQIVTAKPPMGLTHHVERSIERGTFQDMLDPAVLDWPLEEALAFTKLALRCAELRRKDRPDLGSVILPELNRLRNFGHEWEGGRSSGWSSSSSNTTSSSSGFGSTPHTYANGVPRPWSQANQERMRSNPQMGLPWKSSSDFQASGSSAAS